MLLEVYAVINIGQRDTRLVNSQLACAQVVVYGIGCLVLQNVHPFKGDGVAHILAVDLIADRKVENAGGVKLESHRLVLLVDGLVVDDACSHVGFHGIHVDWCVAETTLQRILHTHVEHVLLSLANHPFLSAQHLHHVATVIQLVAPLLVKSAIFRLEERTVHLSVETTAHVVLQGDVGTVVAGITLVYQWLFNIVEQAVHRTESASIDAHRRVEAILIVGVETQVQVVRELIHICGQKVVSLGQAEVLVGHCAIRIAEEISVQFLNHGVQSIAQRNRMALAGFPFHAGARLNAEVLGQKEIAARETNVEAQVVSGLPKV